MYKLIGTDGNRLYSFELKPGSFTLGRSSERDFHVPDSTVSRTHARIEVRDGGESVYVTDTGSYNGTTVNNVRIETTVHLKLGDRVGFGRTDFKLASESERTMAPTKPPTRALLSEGGGEKSVFLSINEALKPLPSKVTDLPEVFPTLSEMARILVLSDPKEVMLERSLRLISKVIPSERLAVLLNSDSSTDAESLYPAATLLPSGKDPGEFRLSKTIATEILNEKNAIVIGDTRDDPRFAQQQSIILAELRSAMAAPLFDEGRVLGILYVDTTNPVHRYNDDYLRLLATFANIIASRLLNYELLQERQEKQLFEAELRRAASIQQTLLQKANPNIPGYLVHAYQVPCRTVGGDLFEIARLPSGRTVLIVADVSGKGLGAAMLMSNILASFRILYNVTEFTLQEVVQMVSRELHHSSGPSDFATLFVGVLNSETHQLDYINAGHNPPLLVRSDGNQELLEACGFMIGAFAEGSWDQRVVKMGPEDMLFIYSDGVTEAEDESGKQYGHRLDELINACRTLEPKAIIGRVIEDIDAFVGEAPRSDDITMLALKRDK